MPNPCIEQRLEIPFNYGATYGPRFQTDIGSQSDGSEQRSPRWIDPLIFIDLAQYSVNADEIDYLLSFHASVKGSGIGFRIKDWSDYLCPCYTLGTGNGTEQTWQLTKTYTIGAYSVKRAILKPVAGSVVLRVDGVIAESGWSIDTTTGVITTTLTGVLSVDEFEFDVAVRFEQDKINFAFDAADNWGNKFFKMQALTCVELRIKPQIYPSLDPLPPSLPQLILGYDYGTTGGPEFRTSIVQAGSEFEDRKSFWDNPLGEWNIGDRGLSRAETDYLIAFFRLARGMAVPFDFYDWQDGTTKRVRFSEDTIRLRFDAYREGDRQVQFNLGGIGVKEVSREQPYYYAPRFLKVYFTNPGHATNGYAEKAIRYSGPVGGYDLPFTVDSFWDTLASPNQGIAWQGPIINGEQTIGGYLNSSTSQFITWGFLYSSYNGIEIYQVEGHERVVLVPGQVNFFIQLPATNLSSIDEVKDKETDFVYTLNTHYTNDLVGGRVNIIEDTAIADSTGLEIRYRF